MTLILGQLFLALVLRYPQRSIWHAGYENRAIPLTVLGTLAAVIGVVLLPGLRDLMKLSAPAWWWWPAAAGLAAAATLWLEPFKARVARSSAAERAR
jgi:hypothetical protein